MKQDYWLKLSVGNPTLHLSRSTDIFSYIPQTISKSLYSSKNDNSMDIFRKRIEKKSINIEVNEVASEIIETIYKPLKFSEMISLFQKKYNDTPENVKQNILTFFEELEKTYGIRVIECNNKEEVKASNFRIVGSREYTVPRHITLELTYKCNLKCKHCYNNSSTCSFQEMERDDVFLLLKELDELGVTILELTGREPTLHPNFEEILERAFSYHFEIVAVLSNGTNFTEKTYRILSDNKDRVAVQISIHGNSPDYIEWFTGSRKAYKLATNSIARLSKLGILTRVACNVTPLNVNQMLSLASTVKNLGASVIAFSPIEPIGRASKNPELLLQLHQNEFREFFKNMNVLLKKFGKEFVSVIEEDTSLTINCGVGSRSLSISPNLDVKLCQMSDAVLSNLKKYGRSFKSFLINNSSLLESISRTPAPNKEICGDCENL